MALFGLRIKKTTSIPLLATFHGLDIVFPSRFFQKFVINKFKKLDGVIAVSLFTAQECIDRGIDPDKVHVVRNGVDTGLSLVDTQPGFREILGKKLGIPLNEKKILVSVGLMRPPERIRLVHDPGVAGAREEHHLPDRRADEPEHPMDQMGPRPHASSPFSRLIVLGLGLGIDEIEVRKVLRRPEIVDRVFHLGQQSIEDLVQIIKHADLFVMPNVKLPGRCGRIRPCRPGGGGHRGSRARFRHGRNSIRRDPRRERLFSASGDESRWIDQIQGLLLDLDHLRRFGVQTQQYTVAHFSWEKMVEGYISLFKKYNFRQAPDGKKRSENVPSPLGKSASGSGMS